MSYGSKADDTVSACTFPLVHKTLAIMSLISAAVKSPNNPDFFLGDGVADFLGDGVVDIVSLSNASDDWFVPL